MFPEVALTEGGGGAVATRPLQAGALLPTPEEGVAVPTWGLPASFPPLVPAFPLPASAMAGVVT
jgi:hypothetical protein